MKYIYSIGLILIVVAGYALLSTSSKDKHNTETAYYIESITQSEARYSVTTRAVAFNWDCSDAQCPNGYSQTDLQEKYTITVSDTADITFVSDPYYELVRLGIIEIDEDNSDFQPIGTIQFYDFSDALQEQGLQIQNTIINSLPFRIKKSDNYITKFEQIYLP